MQKWNASEYITYLYHLVADSDFETGIKEIEIARSLAETLLETHFGTKEYNHNASLEIIQNTEGVGLQNSKFVFDSFLTKFDLSLKVKKAIFDDMQTIAMADGKVTISENETIDYIKRNLQAVVMPVSW